MIILNEYMPSPGDSLVKNGDFVDIPLVADAEPSSSTPLQAAETPNTRGEQSLEDPRLTIETLVLYKVDPVKEYISHVLDVGRHKFRMGNPNCSKMRGMIRRLVLNVCCILVLTTTKLTPGATVKAITMELYGMIFSLYFLIHNDDNLEYGGWPRRMVRKSIQDGKSYGVRRLKACRLWPSFDASFELRQQMWDLLFCPDVVAVVFGG